MTRAGWLLCWEKVLGARVKEGEEVPAERALDQVVAVEVVTRVATFLIESEGRAGGFARCRWAGRGRR